MNDGDLRCQMEAIFGERDPARRGKLARELAAGLLAAAPPPFADEDEEVDGLADLYPVAEALRGQLATVEARIPADLALGLRKKVRAAIDAVDAVRARVTSIREAKAALLAAEREMRALGARENELARRIAELESLRAAVSPARVEALHEQVRGLEAEVLPREEECTRLAARAGTLGGRLEEHARLRREVDTLEQAWIDAFRTSVDRLAAVADAGDARVLSHRLAFEAEVGRCRVLVERLEALDTELARARDAHSSALALYRAWFSADETARMGVSRSAPPELAPRIEALARTSHVLAQQLTSFEADLAAVVGAREELQARLRSLNLTTLGA